MINWLCILKHLKLFTYVIESRALRSLATRISYTLDSRQQAELAQSTFARRRRTQTQKSNSATFAKSIWLIVLDLISSRTIVYSVTESGWNRLQMRELFKSKSNTNVANPITIKFMHNTKSVKFTNQNSIHTSIKQPTLFFFHSSTKYVFDLFSFRIQVQIM